MVCARLPESEIYRIPERLRQAQNRQQQDRQQNQQRSSAVSGSSRGGNDARAASQRGKQSMPDGARSKQPANKKQR